MSTEAAAGVSATRPDPIRARRGGFVYDLLTVAGRGIRAIPREPEALYPALIVPAFFFLVNIGALESLTEGSSPEGFDFRAFQVPTAIIFAVTGISRASTL